MSGVLFAAAAVSATLPGAGGWRSPLREAWAALGGPPDDPLLPVDPALLEPRRMRPTDENAQGAPPNVLLLILESIPAKWTTLHRPDLDTTPHLAELARRGRWARRMYTSVPHTSKAMVSMMCGIAAWPEPALIEARDEGVPVDCLAELLGRIGYDTAYMQSSTRLMDRFDVLMANLGFETFKDSWSMPEGFDVASNIGFEDKALLGPAFEWIDAPREGPFFLTLLTLTSHYMYHVPGDFPRRRYADDPQLDDFLNCVRYTDSFIGELVAGLEARGLMETTALLIVSDHGEAFGEHGDRFHNDSLYEESIHIPFVAVGPGTGPAGVPIEGVRQLQDVAPTILELAGRRLEGGRLDGRSLFSTPGHDSIFVNCFSARTCLAQVERDWKFIDFFDRRSVEVYRLDRDPEERRDLVAAGEVDEAWVRARLEAGRRWLGEVRSWWLQATRRSAEELSDSPQGDPLIPADIVFGEAIRFRGLEPIRPAPRLGGDVDLWLHFAYLKDLSPAESIELFMVDDRQSLFVDIGTVLEGPVKAGGWISLRYRFRLPLELPPLSYRLMMVMRRAGEARPLEVEGSGLPIDQEFRSVELARIDLRPRAARDR